MTTPSFPYLDYRSKMPRAKWSIGTRAATMYFTIHYNGPAVTAFGSRTREIAQLQFDATYHMRPGALGAASGGDGIQYHGATLSDGLNLQLRDWAAMLWHCGNYTGNRLSIAWHLPLGGYQNPTDAQLHQLFDIVIPAFQAAYEIKYVNVKGHKEWKATSCPGNIFPRLLDWRHEHAQLPRLLYYTTLANVKVRESPEIKADNSNVALNGTAIIPAGTTFAVDKLVQGKEYLGITTYAHRADGLGFMLLHPDLLKQAT